MQKRTRVALATAAATAMLVTACSQGETEGGTTTADGELSGTCTILQYEAATTAQYKGWERALEIFSETYPEVDLEWSTTSFDAIRANAKILLSGNEVPDVLLFNTGNADGGQLASHIR